MLFTNVQKKTFSVFSAAILKSKKTKGFFFLIVSCIVVQNSVYKLQNNFSLKKSLILIIYTNGKKARSNLENIFH